MNTEFSDQREHSARKTPLTQDESAPRSREKSEGRGSSGLDYSLRPWSVIQHGCSVVPEPRAGAAAGAPGSPHSRQAGLWSGCLWQ